MICRNQALLVVAFVLCFHHLFLSSLAQYRPQPRYRYHNRHHHHHQLNDAVLSPPGLSPVVRCNEHAELHLDHGMVTNFMTQATRVPTKRASCYKGYGLTATHKVLCGKDGKWKIRTFCKKVTRVSQLEEIALTGDVAAIRNLLDFQHADVDSRDDLGYGWTPLIAASSEGHVEAMRLLIDRGANVDAKTAPLEGGETALMKAITAEHLEAVRVLLDEGGANVHVLDDRYGQPALTMLLADGHWSGVKMTIFHLLLQHGADVNFQNKEGYTPLIWAARNGLEDPVRILIDLGAETGTAAADGLDAYLWAVVNKHSAVADVLNNSALLTTNGGVRRPRSYDTALLTLVSMPVDSIDTLRYVLEKGADLNAKSPIDGESVLIKSILAAGDNGMARFLLKNGPVDVNAKSIDGTTAVITAASMGLTKLVDTLLDFGAAINNQDIWGNSALIKAAENGYSKTVRLLLDRGADIYARTSPSRPTSRGRTALMMAAHRGKIGVVTTLLEAGGSINDVDYGDWTALLCAAQSYNTDMVRLLIDRGADVKSKNNRGETALHLAAEAISQSMKPDVIRLLLEKGAFVNARTADGYTPLMKAVKNAAAAKLIIGAGADVDARLVTGDGSTALIMGILNGEYDYVKVLLENGANVNARRRSDLKTPLMFAVQQGNASIIRMLLEKHANVDAIDSAGWTARHYASKSNRDDLVRLLDDKSPE